MQIRAPTDILAAPMIFAVAYNFNAFQHWLKRERQDNLEIRYLKDARDLRGHRPSQEDTVVRIGDWWQTKSEDFLRIFQFSFCGCYTMDFPEDAVAIRDAKLPTDAEIGEVIRVLGADQTHLEDNSGMMTVLELYDQDRVTVERIRVNLTRQIEEEYRAQREAFRRSPPRAMEDSYDHMNGGPDYIVQKYVSKRASQGIRKSILFNSDSKTKDQQKKLLERSAQLIKLLGFDSA